LLVLTKKQFFAWSGVIGSVASVIGLYVAFYPPPSAVPQPQKRIEQTQTGGSNNTQIGVVKGDLTVNQLPLATPGSAFQSPTDRARAELQQLGVTWNAESFVGSIVDGDLRSAGLFLKGGMRPDLNYKGASAAVYALQPKANNREAMLALLLSNGLNPNADLIDARIMPGLSDTLPPNFEHRLTPSDYSAWKRQFAGPADLWLVIRSSYAGPQAGDFQLLRALATRGAKFDVSLAFLHEYEPIFGNTPVYWEVRNEVERLAKVPITHHKG
jgi:hypothetical protein